MSVADALQLMLMFGTFIVALIALIVEIVKQSKNNRLSSGQLAVI
ncbi:putative holin-like toxin [Apilactobacillus timberlakei]|uniref:Holin-like toxin n=1 Tax=Apilactobacillus timberlakei TaxID=2008380 RepID=A0ABY2YXI2_9LACO|nr:putative holin-like toxin [Apilactobacillus timberlakei]TPR13075.1 putative holin-like toxin [Apilactobacillus timberlakei]TPR14126.1 putative holin-like toxin [Apilactobacillus timberlakei]TPR16380.1 putative holin-like toxin [Apilactobacillus timberlakei]